MHYINHQQSSFFHHAMALILDYAPPPTTTTRDVPAPEIKNFKYTHQFDHGSLTVRAVAGHQEKEQSNKLLLEAFEEMTSRRARLKQKLIRLRAAVSGTYYRPNSVTLVGFYKASGAADGQEAIVGTVEVWFDVVESFVTPDVPNGATYVCNLTVRGDMRSYSSNLYQTFNLSNHGDWTSKVIGIKLVPLSKRWGNLTIIDLTKTNWK
ncbi:hypothetical protein QJS04_geneDACA013275 [Acorus gramineus]|uniref:Uncharacterized protein n=1 Tax=Acorus gramineus TaxID=55184 RepID=A0AAV9BBU4_ACOGR|nr:hypothetical protein QJS04_geneDACA013275 [Acorus gramineus]